MFEETLKEIVPGIEVSCTTHLISSNNFPPLLDQNEYADMLYPFLKQKFNKHHFSLFSEEVLEKDLIFQDDKKDTPPPKEIQDLISVLQSGTTLKSVYDKYTNANNFVYIFLLYIFLKGNVYFSSSSFNTNHYLYERYRSLDKFIEKTPSKKFFSIVAGIPISSPEEIKASYLSFVQYNHPDKIGPDMPENFINLVTKIYKKIQDMSQRLTDMNIKNQEEKEKKHQSFQREMLVAEKKKICERYLSNKQYKEAFALISSISSNIISENIQYQLLYLWLHFETKDIKTDIHKVHEYMKNVQAINKDLRKETLYHYVLGLYHENKNNYSQAKMCFENAKLTEPSFQPCYPAINRCSLVLLKEDRAKKTIFSKAINYVKEKIEKKGA